MKKKLTVNALALGNLKARKKQYTVMIIGIILAMVFSSGIMFFISCIISSQEEYAKNAYGNQNLIYANADNTAIKNAYENKIIGSYGFAHILGFCYTDEDKIDSGVSIGYLDDNAKEISYISFKEGHYPEKDNEIALEEMLMYRLGIDAKIGDEITLWVLPQNGAELLNKPVNKTYTLVGIVKNKYSNFADYFNDELNGVPAVFVSKNSQIEIGGKESLTAYLCYKTNDEESYSKTLNYLEKFDSQISDNFYAIGKTEGDYLFFNEADYTTIVLSIVLAGILLAASSIAIINSISSNLKERKKQIGMLKTVGATQRQIIVIFGREAFIISLIAAPISAIISYFGVKQIILLFGEDFTFKPNLLVIVICIILSIITVMLSALLPLISISRISPIQSIRDLNVAKKVKKHKIKTQKSFEISKLLAKRYLTFYKSKQSLVSVLLIFTIIISCYGFSYLNYAKDNYYQSPYDYYLNLNSGSYTPFVNLSSIENGYTENDKQLILNSPYVKSVTGTKQFQIMIMLDEYNDYLKLLCYTSINNNIFTNDYEASEYKNILTEENIDSLLAGKYSDNYIEIKNKYNYDCELFLTQINAVDTTVIEQLENSVIDGKINIDKLNSGEEIILIAPQEVAFFYNENDSSYGLATDTFTPKGQNTIFKTRYCTYKAGDEIKLSVLSSDDYEENSDNYQRKDKTVKIGAILSNTTSILVDSGCEWTDHLTIITTLSGFNQFAENQKYNQLNISLKTECTPEIDNYMQNTLETISQPIKNSNIYSDFGKAQSEIKYYRSLMISLLSVIVLFLSISASIINNSLTARIRESKSEIGTLRAVGATEKDLVMSFIRQLLSLFGWGYIVGFGLFGISYGILDVLSKRNVISFNFSLNISFTVIACLILFLICAFNLWLKVRKEMKNSIIDNIREL